MSVFAESLGLYLNTIGLLPLIFDASEPRFPCFDWMRGPVLSPCFWIRSSGRGSGLRATNGVRGAGAKGADAGACGPGGEEPVGRIGAGRGSAVPLSAPLETSTTDCR